MNNVNPLSDPVSLSAFEACEEAHSQNISPHVAGIKHLTLCILFTSFTSGITLLRLDFIFP